MVNILLVLLLQTQVTGSDVTGSISGHVQNRAGQPLPAVVSIGVAAQSRADSLGDYRLDKVPSGTVDVTAWANGYQVANQLVLVEGNARLDFVLDTMSNGVIPAGSVFGVVRDTAGHPVATAVVSVNGFSHGVLTDSLGQYHLDSVPPGTIGLLVRRIGYDGAIMNTMITAGQRRRADFVLVPRVYYLGPVGLDNESAVAGRLHLK